jgi:hypothetical protein
VHEHVGAVIVGRNEAEASICVEELHSAARHRFSFAYLPAVEMGLSLYRRQPLADKVGVERSRVRSESRVSPYLGLRALNRRAMAPAVATPGGRPSAEKVESFHHSDQGKTRDKIGHFAGVSGRSMSGRRFRSRAGTGQSYCGY